MEVLKCHVCKSAYLYTSDERFTMRCESCGTDENVCRRCVTKMFVKSINESGSLNVETMPDPTWGGVMLEAYSEVVPV